MGSREIALTALVAVCSQGCAFLQDEIAEHGGHHHGGGGSSVGTGGGSGGTDADAGTTGEDANSGDDAAPLGDAAAEGTAYLRFGNFASSPVDYCLRPHDPADTAPFTIGPVLASRGVATGISSGSVTQYLALPSGQYDVRDVPLGSSDCSTRRDPTTQGRDRTKLSVLPSGTSWTFALMPYANHDATLVAVQDERAPAEGRALLRGANIGSYPSINLDFGFVADDAFAPLLTNVPLHAVSSGPGVDPLGYLPIEPISGATLAIRHSTGTGIVAKLANLDLPAGAVVTAYASVTGPMFLCSELGDSSEPLVSCRDSRVAP